MPEFLLEQEAAQFISNGKHFSPLLLSSINDIAIRKYRRNLSVYRLIKEISDDKAEEEQSGFVINLTRGQKEHYGSQFDEEKSETPGIIGKRR